MISTQCVAHVFSSSSDEILVVIGWRIICACFFVFWHFGGDVHHVNLTFPKTQAKVGEMISELDWSFVVNSIACSERKNTHAFPVWS